MKFQKLLLLIALILAALALPLGAGAADSEYTYTVYSGEAEITGYTGSAAAVSIPSYLGGYPVKSIGYSAFSGNTKITSASIPVTVTEIGNFAFQGCSNLKTLSLPYSIKTIGQYAFEGCSSLTYVSMPGSLQTIGPYAFRDCAALTGTLAIPDSVTSIGICAFEGTGYTSVSASIALTHTGAAYNSNVSEYFINRFPETVTYVSLSGEGSIGDYAFCGAENLGNVSAPGMTGIGEAAFKNCTGMVQVSMPASLKTIGSFAFYNCDSLTFSLPSGVTSIGNAAFWGCVRLNGDLIIPEEMTVIPPNVFYGCSGLRGTLTLHEGITSIGSHAFYGCSNLTGELKLPAGLTSLGSSAFYGCGYLTGEMVIPEGITAIPDSVFERCYQLEKLTLHDGVLSIGKSSFASCYGLTGSLDLPDGITSIGYGAFSSCRGLTGELVLPSALTTLENYVFSGCTGLTGSIPAFPEGLASIPVGLFDGCTGFTGDFRVPETITSIGKYAFRNCSGLNGTLTLHENLSIASPSGTRDGAAFQGTSFAKLECPVSFAAGKNCSQYYNLLYHIVGAGHTGKLEIHMTGEGVLPAYCFAKTSYNASPLTAVTLDEGITGVGDRAFSGSELTGISMPGVETVGKNAFFNCDSLTEIAFSDRLASLGESAFSGCDALETAVFLRRIGSVDISGTALADTVMIYCYESSPIDFWALEIGREVTYLNAAEPVPVVRLELPEDCRLEVGQSMAAAAQIFPVPPEGSVAWTSSAPEVVSVENGVMTALAVGEAIVTASCGGKSASMTVTTFAYIQDFDLSAPEIWLVSKDSLRISAISIRPAGADGSFTWSSSDETVFTVDEDGVIFGKVPGEAVLTAATDQGVERSCTVHVCYPVSEIRFADVPEEALIGSSFQIRAEVISGSETLINRLVEFSSSDESIASIDEEGFIRTHAAGSVQLTATAKNGVSAGCTLAVREPRTLVLPSGLQVIEAEAFEGITAEAVFLPGSCISIGSRAFADCVNLISVEFRGADVSIAEDAFEGCENVSFVCAPDSGAARYAEQYGIFWMAE